MFDHDVIDFEVEKFHLNTEEGYPISPEVGVGIRRTDNKVPLAIVSEAYEPVQYKNIVTSVEEALGISGLDMTDAEFETNVFDDGAKLELRAKFPAHTMYLDKDKVKPEFCFRTSHNSTWANNGMMGLWRDKCWNTLVSGDKLAYVYGRHTKNFNVSAFAAKIRNAAAYIAGDGLSQMRDWYHTEISRDATVDLFTKTLAKRMDNVTRKPVANKVMLSNLMKIFDEENRHLHGRGTYEKYATRNNGTLWTAYQAATHWSSHDKVSSSARPSHSTIGGREEKVRKMLQSKEWLALAA
jgi:hypothetical protein